MKAVVLTEYGPRGVLHVREVSAPIPEEDEVLLSVRAVSVNDWDWCLMRGTPFYIRLLYGLLEPNIKIPGVDVAGVVEAVGRNVERFEPGDAVYGDLSSCGFGAFAEYVCANESALAPKPTDMTFVDAAAIPHAAMLAVQGLLDEGHLRPGQRLLINGAGGGVGTIGLQIAKSIGAEVTGVDHSSKLDMMRSLGFDQVIDYTRENFTKTGRCYDLILDTKTNRSVFEFPRALNPRGRYVTVGGSTDRLLQAVLIGPILSRITGKNIRLVSLKPNKDLAYINELFEAGEVKPVIDGPFEFDAIPEVVQRFGEGRHRGKLVVSLEATG